MAYNPFDDVIDQDPAYMQEGGGTRTGLVQPVTTDQGPRYISSGIAKAYSFFTPEEETLQEIERNKQLRELATAQALQGTKYEDYAGQADLPSFVVQSPGIKERLDQAGYQPQGFKEAASRIGQFFYGDQRKAFDKLSQGQELTQEDRNAIAFSPLDTLDFIFPPVVLKKLANIGLKTVDDVFKASDDIAEVKQVKDYFGGAGFIPEGVMRAPEDGGSGIPKYLPGGRYNPAYGLSQKFADQSEAQANKYKLLEDFYTQNPANKSVSGEQLRAQLQKLLPEGELAIKPDTLIRYAKANPDTAIGKAFKRKLTKEEQVTDDVLNILREDAELRGEPVPINTAAKITGIAGNTMRRLVDENFRDIGEFVSARKPGVTAKNIFHSYFPSRYGESNIDEQTVYTMINDAYRSGRFGNISNFEKEMAEYGIVPQRIKEGKEMVPNPEYKYGDKVFEEQQKEAKKKFINFMINDLFEGPKGYEKLRNLIIKRNDLSNYTRSEFPKLVMSNPGLKEQFVKEFQEKLSTKYKSVPDKGSSFEELYNNPATRDEAIEKMATYFASKSLNGNMAHVMEIGKIKGTNPKKKLEFALGPGLRGKMNNPEFYRINFAAHNIAYQKEYENIIEKSIQKINSLAKKDLTKIKMEDLEKAVSKIQKVNQQMINNNMSAYIRLSDVQLSDRGADLLKRTLGDVTISKENKGHSIFLGSKEDKSLPELKNIFNDRMARYIQDPKSFKISQQRPDKAKIEDEMFIFGSAPYIKKGFPLNFKQGGPVRMAMGGDPLQNLNQQQFTPDPAFEGEDYFQQAVESGNLQAFNPTKLFRLFNKTDAVYTPKKLPDPVAEQQAAPPGTTLPTTQTVQPEDFAFQSFTLNKILDPQAPKAGTPEAWKQFLYGGGQGGKVPEAEMFDTGLEQFLDDYAKYYPNQKIDRQALVDYYEMSPIGNIEIKVKAVRDNEEITNPGYRNYVGKPRHQNMGSQPLDEVGTSYREVVVNSGSLPGEKKPFVESSHFSENNVLGFTRVADYKQPDGKTVAVIQELQTDMLTKVRKEQERLQALLKRIENIKAKAAQDLQSGDPYREASATRALEELNQSIPPKVEETLKQHQDLIKPFPNEAAKSTIPDYQKQLSDLQLQIEDVLQKDIQQNRPETGFQIEAIANQQQEILNSLLDLNRSGQLDDVLKNVRVPATKDTDELIQYGADTNVRDLETGARYNSLKDLELFPPIPFNKQADYVDLLLKATIKDAQSKGISKVAIYPPELVNQRWGKRPDSDAGKKFRDLYGKVAIQQMKNIAKKYGGDAKVEIVLNPNASDRGLSYFKRNIDGEFDFMKQDQLAQGLEPEEAQLFIDEQLNRNAHALGSNQVIYAKEVAPGQTMDYYVQPYTTDASEKKFELIPLGPGDDRNAAQVIVEEYNPQEIQMFTITLDSDKAKAPMFMFKKKSGGSIDKDSLVSITDIYGEYGR